VDIPEHQPRVSEKMTDITEPTQENLDKTGLLKLCRKLRDLSDSGNEALANAFALYLLGSDEPSEMVNGVAVKKSVVCVLEELILSGMDPKMAEVSVRGLDSGLKLPREAFIGALDRVGALLTSPTCEDPYNLSNEKVRGKIIENVTNIRNALHLPSVTLPAAAAAPKIRWPSC
jgi:hypothetical protein